MSDSDFDLQKIEMCQAQRTGERHYEKLCQSGTALDKTENDII